MGLQYQGVHQPELPQPKGKITSIFKYWFKGFQLTQTVTSQTNPGISILLLCPIHHWPIINDSSGGKHLHPREQSIVVVTIQKDLNSISAILDCQTNNKI